MRRPEFIARQAACPSGILGRLIATVMAFETADANRRALDLLGLAADDQVLEIGFGHGRTIAEAVRRVPRGFVAGVDTSDRMMRMATRSNRRRIADGQVDLRLADSAHLPYPDARFDKAYAVHTIYFWRQPLDHLREIARVLRPGGRFVLGFRPRDDAGAADFPAAVYRFYDAGEVTALLRAAGFGAAETTLATTPQGTIAFAVAQRT